MKTYVERMYIEALEVAMSHIKLSEQKVQINKITERNYRRLNQLILVAKQTELQSKSNEWISKEQLAESGYKIKEGEHFGTQLFSYKLKDSENGKVKTYSYYTVYNLEQLEGKNNGII
jgi:antirestriction protein ArdC